MAGILVIEDDCLIRKVLARLLETLGHRVWAAGDGVQGVDLYDREAVDLVITDIHMPRMDGLEVIRNLTASNPQVKLVAISGGDPSGQCNCLDTAIQYGARRALRKPFALKEVSETVRELLDE